MEGIFRSFEFEYIRLFLHEFKIKNERHSK